MLAAAEEIRQEFLHRQVGRTLHVLCEQYKDGVVTGYTENYTPVEFRSDAPRKNEVVAVKIVGVEGDVCVGEVR